MYPLISVVQIVKNHGDVLTKKHTIHVRHNGQLILTSPHKRGLFRITLCVRPTFDPHYVINHMQEPLSPKGNKSLSMHSSLRGTKNLAVLAMCYANNGQTQHGPWPSL